MKTCFVECPPVLKVLDESGKVKKKLEPKLKKSDLLKMYHFMVLARLVDDKALKLQRSGRMGTFAQVQGQEAAQVGAMLATKKTDWIVPAFRETAAYIAKELPLEGWFLFNMGNEFGQQMPKGSRFLPIAIPVGTQILHAAGLAWGSKIQKKKDVTVTFFGDGATSEGDFHDAMNFAGVFQVPCVFICQNNQWAISTPREQQTASATIAQKATAYGLEGIQVDGNDALAMYSAVKDAVEKARKGKGSTLIEAVTYRLAPHTTSDDPSLYRSEKDVVAWRKKDPITRFRKYLEAKKLWDKKKEGKLIIECQKLIEKAVAKAEKTPKPKNEDIFKYTFASMDQHLTEQLAYLKEVSQFKLDVESEAEETEAESDQAETEEKNA